MSEAYKETKKEFDETPKITENKTHLYKFLEALAKLQSKKIPKLSSISPLDRSQFSLPEITKDIRVDYKALLGNVINFLI